jgi:hypothetical protein
MSAVGEVSTPLSAFPSPVSTDSPRKPGNIDDDGVVGTEVVDGSGNMLLRYPNKTRGPARFLLRAEFL